MEIACTPMWRCALRSHAWKSSLALEEWASPRAFVVIIKMIHVPEFSSRPWMAPPHTTIDLTFTAGTINAGLW